MQPKEFAIPLKYQPNHKSSCTDPNSNLSLGVVECKNGSKQYKAYCPACLSKGGPISYVALADIDISSTTIIRSHEVKPCERCGSVSGSELHHWAPHHLFSDADSWPQSYLCKACHIEWHRKVTPHMHANNNTRKEEAA